MSKQRRPQNPARRRAKYVGFTLERVPDGAQDQQARRQGAARRLKFAGLSPGAEWIQTFDFRGRTNGPSIKRATSLEGAEFEPAVLP